MMHKLHDASPRRQPKGLQDAVSLGRIALAAWIDEGVVLSPEKFAAKWEVSVHALNAAVRSGELFTVSIANRPYYVASLLHVKPQSAAAVCKALAPFDDMEKCIFWLRAHGGLGGQTAAAAIVVGELDRVVELADACTAQARAAHHIEQLRRSRPSRGRDASAA